MVAFLLTGLTARAQQPPIGPAPNPPQLQLRAPSSDALLLDMIARDAAGLPLQGLGGDHLMLLDNKKPVSADHWKLLTAEAATQVIVVLDAVNSSLPELVRSEDAVERTLQSHGGRLDHALTILIVSDTEPKADTGSATTALHRRQLFVHRIPASSDPHELLQALKDYRPGLQRILEAQGGSAQAERVRLSLEALSFIANAEKTLPGAKIVAWMSPGWPYLAESDARSSQQLYDSVVYFSDLLREARLMLYVVNPEGVAARDTSSQMEGFELATRPGINGANTGTAHVPQTIGRDYYKAFLKGVTRANDADPNDLALQVLAIQSGGLVLPESNDLKAQLERCMAEADAVATLAYTPSRAKEVYHAISVERSGGGKLLRSRTGFYLR